MSTAPQTEALQYAGDLSPDEAWTKLAAGADVVLVDVRTTAEWQYVGLPDLRSLDKEPLLVDWQVFPQMQVNPRFVEELTAKGAKPEQTLLFLCRSGVRSRHAAAAMTAAGFPQCFNVSEGFEGDKDSHGHRGHTGGWKMRGLPWLQG